MVDYNKEDDEGCLLLHWAIICRRSLEEIEFIIQASHFPRRSRSLYDDEDEEDFGETLNSRTEELYSVQDAVPNRDGLIECAVLPLRDMVVFPHMVAPIFVGREASLLAIEEAQMENRTLIALTQRNPEDDNPGLDGFASIGVEVAVGRLLNVPDGSSSALVQARRERRPDIARTTGQVRPLEARGDGVHDRHCTELATAIPQEFSIPSEHIQHRRDHAQAAVATR